MRLRNCNLFPLQPALLPATNHYKKHRQQGLASAERAPVTWQIQQSPHSRGTHAGALKAPVEKPKTPRPTLRTCRAGSRPPATASAPPPRRPRPLRPAAATPDVRRGPAGRGRGLRRPSPPLPLPAGGGLRAGLPAPIPLTLFCAFVLVHTSRWSRSESFPSVPRAGAHLARRRGPRWRRRVRARGQPIAGNAASYRSRMGCSLVK